MTPSPVWLLGRDVDPRLDELEELDRARVERDVADLHLRALAEELVEVAAGAQHGTRRQRSLERSTQNRADASMSAVAQADVVVEPRRHG